MAFGPEPRLAQAQVGVERIDEGLRSYMLQVYNYMGLGLAITGAVAYFMAASGALSGLVPDTLHLAGHARPTRLCILLTARRSRP